MLAQTDETFVLFPAHAGVIPHVYVYIAEKASVPRTRGGDPFVANTSSIIANCSPHTRG